MSQTDKQPKDVTDELLNESEPFSEHGEHALELLEDLVLSRERLIDLGRRTEAELKVFNDIERKLTGHVLLVPEHEHRRLMRELSKTVVNTLRKLREQ